MSNSSLASFFTTGKDPSTWRPFTLLKSEISHAYLLNVIAANRPSDFIVNCIVEDHYMVDDILPELNGFTATHYITYVKEYFGIVDTNRINNALGLDFVYEQCFAAKEYNLYGSSRLGTKKDTSLLLNTHFKASSTDSTGNFVKDVLYYNYVKEYDTFQTSRILAFKQFELSNHLGNVLATILDRRTLHEIDTNVNLDGDSTFIAIWDADIVGAQDYYPFGMLLPDRVYSADSKGSGNYRYGFNGKEHDPGNEW